MKNTTQTTPAHTPTPWFLDGPFTILIDVGNDVKGMMITAKFPKHDDPLPVARVTGPAYFGREDEVDPELMANAEFIVRACNNHEQLLKLAEEFSDACSTRISLLQDDLKENFGDPDDIQDMIGHWMALKNECDRVIRNANGKVS